MPNPNYKPFTIIYIIFALIESFGELLNLPHAIHYFTKPTLMITLIFYFLSAVNGINFKDKILFHGLGWIEHLPDWTSLRTLYRSVITRSRDTRDDTILGAVVDAFNKHHLQVLPATELVPQLVVDEGCLTQRSPNRREMLDIEFGWQIARHMGGLDIGQSITVRDQTVLGVEAVEGTDALIVRTGQLCPRGGFTLIKVAKPNQDMRFDVPTIGLRTLENLVRTGSRTIAIEAHRTILVDRHQTLAFAKKHGIAIIALSKAETGVLVHRRAA